jgi:iron complex transport system ATP-binding protein
MILILKGYSDGILRDIDLKIRDENLIILGSNGAGKSTLAKVLCGITYSKELILDGEKLYRLSAKERSRRINYIPPKLEIFDEYLTVEDFLELSRLYAEIDIKRVIELFDLDKLTKLSCKTLSSGEQQRLLLASALLHGAKITIFDEPTANLDSNRAIEVYKMLKSDSLKSKIVITHDLTLAYHLGYRVVYIEDGKIVFDGNNRDFFKESNLKKFFSNSLKRVDDYFVVDYLACPVPFFIFYSIAKLLVGLK